MRTPKFFITGLFCLIFSIQFAFAQNLNTKITIKLKDATLPQVLQHIQKKYGYRFSYLNNELPTKTRFSAEITNKPLSEVLDVLLEKTDLGYKQTNGQIIIKKGFPKAKPKTTTFQKLSPPAAENKSSQTVKTTPEPGKNIVKTTPANPEKKTVANPEQAPATSPQNGTENLVKSDIPADEKLDDSLTVIKMAGKKETIWDKLAAIRRKNESLVASADTVLLNDYHFGIFPPISTNGVEANKYVNKASAHLVVSKAAGLEGVEFAGFGNLEKSYVSGAQFAGFFNMAKNNSDLFKLADSRNQGYTLNGGQFAGFFNLANGTVKGGQFGGYMNVATGHLKGGQFAGFLNIAKDVYGVQAAGYMNVGKNIDGAQLAGFLNIADTVSGVQAAGFLNVTKCIKGTQIAFMNVADSASGVPIGLFNFVNKGGYKRAEFYVADDFDANITYKLGVSKFYSMLALGAELDGKKRWAYGYGLGSEWSVAKYFKVNTDLISYYLIEESFEKFPDALFDDYQLNLVNKFRLLGTLQFAKHFSLFGGPTYNVSVSQFQEEGSEKIGTTLPTNTFYDHTSDGGTNVKMWIGFNAGIRF